MRGNLQQRRAVGQCLSRPPARRPLEILSAHSPPPLLLHSAPLFVPVSPVVAPRRTLATVAAQSGSRFKRNWLSDSATYPIIGIMTVAVSIVLYAGTRQAVKNPEVNWAKDADKATTYDEKEAMEHYAHGLRKHALTPGATQVMSRINAVGTGSKPGQF